MGNIFQKSQTQQILLKLTVVGVWIISVILLSELAYLIRHNEWPKVTVFVWATLSKKQAKDNHADKAWEDLMKAVRINQKFSSSLTDGLVPTSFDLTEDKRTKRLALRVINDTQIPILMESEQFNLGILFYRMALDAEQEEWPELTGEFLQQAVYLSPQLGHYHVELANYYKKNDRRDEAYLAIEYCLQFEYPRNQCQKYADEELNADSFYPIGYLRDGLKDYYGILAVELP